MVAGFALAEFKHSCFETPDPVLKQVDVFVAHHILGIVKLLVLGAEGLVD